MAAPGDYPISAHRMEPKDDEKFYPSAVRRIISDILSDKLSSVTYDDKTAQSLALEISNLVKLKCKALKMPRYKIIVQTFIGENLNQGLRVASKSLWNPKFDNYASQSFQSASLFAVVMVFGSYYE
jgi:tctex1 domain-containing protein 2